VAVVHCGRVKASDMASGLSLATNPAVFLHHAEEQRTRLAQERKASSKRGKMVTFEIFESQRKADKRAGQVEPRIKNASGREAQAEYRRHHIEPANIYISIWHKADKGRAFRRIRANRARWLHMKADWVEVKTGGPAGSYYYHQDTRSVRWEPPDETMMAEMKVLDDEARVLEIAAQLIPPEQVSEEIPEAIETSDPKPMSEDSLRPVSPHIFKVITADNYMESFNGPC